MALRRTNRGRPRSSAQRQRSSQSVSQLFHGAHKLDSHSALEHSLSKLKERLSIFALLVRWRT